MLEPQNSERLLSDLQTLSFEEAFTRLGGMVETLESGGLPLAQAAELFEQGMTLVRRCSELLEETELRISLVRDNAGAPTGGQPWPDDSDLPPPDDEWIPDEDFLRAD